MTKRLLTTLLFAILFVTVFTVSASAAVDTDKSYNVNDSIRYAENHWNDGKGLCAEFVSDCLKAGGVDNVYERMVENLYNELLAEDWGTSNKLRLSGERISMAANAGKVKKGDPVFFYCNSCHTFAHVVLCNGADSAGYMVDYAHNNPHNGRRATYTYRHNCGCNNWTMYSIRMNDSDTIYSENKAVKAPKVTSVSNTSTGALVKWNAISGATGYRVYRRVDNSSWVYLTTVKTNSYTDTAALNGTQVYYTVRACNGSKWSGYYGGYRFTFMEQVDYTSIKTTNSSIVLSWEKNARCDCYYLYRSVNGSNWVRYKDIKNPDITSFTDTNVSSGNIYRYRIRVGKGNNISSYDYKGVSAVFLGAPVMRSIKNNNDGITITWSSVAGSTGYRVYRRGVGERYWTYLTTVTGNSYTDENVESGSYYRYTVRSASGRSFGGFDANGRYLRCVATPDLIEATYADNEVTLTWSDVEGVAGYYVYHKLDTDRYWTRIAVIKGDITSYVDTTVKEGETYLYTVKAFYGTLMSSYDADGIECVTEVAVVPMQNPAKREDNPEVETDNQNTTEE